jgi:hypothetical protein
MRMAAAVVHAATRWAGVRRSLTSSAVWRQVIFALAFFFVDFGLVVTALLWIDQPVFQRVGRSSILWPGLPWR